MRPPRGQPVAVTQTLSVVLLSSFLVIFGKSYPITGISSCRTVPIAIGPHDPDSKKAKVYPTRRTLSFVYSLVLQTLLYSLLLIREYPFVVWSEPKNCAQDIGTP